MFTIVMHPHLKALGNEEEENWNTVNYSFRLENYVRWESKNRLGMYNISHAEPYYSDVIINFAILNTLLLKRSVAPGCVISILERKAKKPDIFHDSGH